VNAHRHNCQQHWQKALYRQSDVDNGKAKDGVLQVCCHVSNCFQSKSAYKRSLDCSKIESADV
jgi:hypothetical protein